MKMWNLKTQLITAVSLGVIALGFLTWQSASEKREIRERMFAAANREDWASASWIYLTKVDTDGSIQTDDWLYSVRHSDHGSEQIMVAKTRPGKYLDESRQVEAELRIAKNGEWEQKSVVNRPDETAFHDLFKIVSREVGLSFRAGRP